MGARDETRCWDQHPSQTATDKPGFQRVLVVKLLQDLDLAYGGDRELWRHSQVRAKNEAARGSSREGTLTPSRSLSMRIFLSATISLVPVSFAMYTCLAAATE
jgi:hypothetical protein